MNKHGPLVRFQPRNQNLTGASAHSVVKERATLFREGSIPLTCQFIFNPVVAEID